MADEHDLEPVDHDPFADQGPQTQPVEHDPFNGLTPELKGFSPAQALATLVKMDERMLNMEMAIARAVFEIRGSLAGMGANVQSLHQSHEQLRRTVAAPKKIVRDETGRPTGVVVDQSFA